MLIPFKTILSKYNLKPTGILHIGGHTGEEWADYQAEGTDRVIFIEALQDRCFAMQMNAIVVNACVSDKAEVVDFQITNNGASSSMFELGTHLTEHPDIYVVRTVKMATVTVQDIFRSLKLDIMDYDFVNIDIQGGELKALRGMEDLLPYVKALYLEVNVKELYKGIPMQSEIEDYVGKFGFKKAEEQITGHGWGDALYLRQ